MKKILLLSILTLTSLGLKAQTEEEQEIILIKDTVKDKVYHNNLLLEKAKFNSKTPFDFYKSNSKFKIVLEEEPSKTTYFNIFIDEKGKIYNYKVIKSLGEKYDNEVKKLVDLMPNWIPAKENGKNVRVVELQKITFIN